MSKTISQYQIGDIVNLTGTVTFVNKDGQIQIELNTHFSGQLAEAFDADLALVTRPLKAGDPVTWGARKPRYGTFQNALNDTLSIVLKDGGSAEEADDLVVVSTLDLKQGSPPPAAAEPAVEPAVEPIAA